jgi:hypothetical protein
MTADWVKVASVSNEYEADLNVGRLNLVGIGARTRKSSDAPGVWLTGNENPFGPIEVYVPHDQLVSAQQSLQLVAHGKAGGSFSTENRHSHGRRCRSAFGKSRTSQHPYRPSGLVREISAIWRLTVCGSVLDRLGLDGVILETPYGVEMNAGCEMKNMPHTIVTVAESRMHHKRVTGSRMRS